MQSSLNAPHFSQHGGTIPSGFKLAINAPSGIIYYTVDGSDPRGSSAIKYISQISFDRHTIVKARTRIDGRWSALTEAYFSPERLGFPVKFHEVMYNPIGGSDYEFIELKNISQTKVNLSRYKMKGVEFRFKLNAEIDPEESTSGGTSDARFITKICPVIEFGLVGKTMHKVDENVLVNDIKKLTNIYNQFLINYFGVRSSD